MATHTSAELDVFDCNLGEGGLDEFEPETPRSALWLRVSPPGPADAPRREREAAPAGLRVWPFVLPVVVSAALVGAALFGVGKRARDVSVPTGGARASQPAPAAAPAVPVAPPAPAQSTRAVAAPPQPVAPEAPTVPADPELERTLATVSDAYRRLDAAALTAVWPGADTTALSESFSALKYQSLAFDRCRTRPDGEDGAVAACEVTIVAAPKDGEPALRRRRESWTLVLGRSGDGWTIAGVTVR